MSALRAELVASYDARQAADEEARRVAVLIAAAARCAGVAASALMRLCGLHTEWPADSPVVLAARKTVETALGRLGQALAAARRQDLARLASVADEQAGRMTRRPPDAAEANEWATAWTHWRREAAPNAEEPTP